MLGKLTTTEIEEIIMHQTVGRIGCHANGITYIVPISYAYDGQYVYMHSYEGQKIDMMRKNPDICIEVDVMSDMANWKSVIAWGTFEELKDIEERNNGLKIL